MHIIGLCGRKGGCGKTTLAVHLSAQLASRGHHVTLVDCDPQSSAGHWAAPGLLPMEVMHMPIESESQVDAWLEAADSIETEILVLDGPPHLNAALAIIIGLSDLVIIPCAPSGLDLVATSETVGLVRQIRADGPTPQILLVPNRVDRRTASGRELQAELKQIGEVVSNPIHSRTAFSDAFNSGTWVGDYAPHSPAHREIEAFTDYVQKKAGIKNVKKANKPQRAAANG